MGRLVACGDDIVWKYQFGEQASEIYRVPRETGIGTHHFVMFDFDEASGKTTWKPVDPSEEEFDGDVLILKSSDADGLADFASKASEPDAFHNMIRAFSDYIRSRPSAEEFVFQGEF